MIWQASLNDFNDIANHIDVPDQLVAWGGQGFRKVAALAIWNAWLSII
jgi:hypothetical protein